MRAALLLLLIASTPAHEGDLLDSPAMTVGCADTLASTIVVGLQLAMEWRQR